MAIFNLDEIKKFVVIGSIDLSLCPINEREITSDNNKLLLGGKAKETVVLIGSREGTVPHVHLISKKWGTCICLHDALYFPHGDNEMKLGTFSSGQDEIFNAWMASRNPKLNQYTNWEYSVYVWKSMYDYRDRNLKDRIIVPSIQPDYSHMKGDYNPNLR